LDLEYHQPGAYGMHPATWQEHGISRLYGYSMKTVRHRAILYLSFEVSLRNAALQSHVELGAGRCVGYVSHLGLWFSTQFSSLLARRMHLKRKLLLRVQDFDQQRKSSALRVSAAQQFIPVIRRQPM
jgi:hypothetical protein